MPYRQVYEPAPSDMTLPVLTELPEGYEEKTWKTGVREADGGAAKHFHAYHYCRHCGGWIEGRANDYRVNTLDSWSLSGRRGTEYYCRRCGERIGFSGMVS